MTDEYERREFWNVKSEKDDICILGKDINKLTDEEIKYLDVRGDSLLNVIRNKQEADEFMRLLKNCIKKD